MCVCKCVKVCGFVCGLVDLSVCRTRCVCLCLWCTLRPFVCVCRAHCVCMSAFLFVVLASAYSCVVAGLFLCCWTLPWPTPHFDNWIQVVHNPLFQQRNFSIGYLDPHWNGCSSFGVMNRRVARQLARQLSRQLARPIHQQFLKPHCKTTRESIWFGHWPTQLDI
jgi:hypothetical protein